jgi:hypothetical protein
MPVMSSRPIPLAPSAEHGTTLIEMLVAILTSIIVLIALLAILEFTLRQESSIADRVSSGQLARQTMSRLVQEMQSSCTGFGETAIQGPATTPKAPLTVLGPTSLWFISAYATSSKEEAVLAHVTEHDIVWKEISTANPNNATKQKLGELVDYQFPSEGGESPNWVFPALQEPASESSPQKKVVLATNVIQPTSGSLFQYYKYNEKGELVGPLSASETAVAAKEEEIAKVEISFTQASDNGDTTAGRTSEIKDAVVLRFDSSVAKSEVGTSPCS